MKLLLSALSILTALTGASPSPWARNSSLPAPPLPGNRTINAAEKRAWDGLQREIDEYGLVGNCVVSVGDERGELWRHEKGRVNFDTEMRIASATKWISGVAIMTVVESGVLSLDDLASKWLPYWTTDQTDSRSRITLRHLLSFAAGISGSTSCPNGDNFLQCVEHMYGRSQANSEPGSEMVYNEVTIMYAGAMASMASRLTMEEIFINNIFRPAGMTRTFWDGNGRPLLGSGLRTVPEDYGNFLNAYFNGALVSEATRTDMERVHYPDAQVTGIAITQGKYGLANWYLCFPLAVPWPERCEAADVHMSVGISGYLPTTDRVNNYWLQIGNEGATALLTLAMQAAIKEAADAAVIASRA